MLPSADRAHFSIAGSQLLMPQKSPIFAQSASAEAVDEPWILDSSAEAEAAVRTSSEMAIAAPDISFMSVSSLIARLSVHGKVAS
jgi:hypothetical protein